MLVRSYDEDHFTDILFNKPVYLQSQFAFKGLILRKGYIEEKQRILENTRDTSYHELVELSTLFVIESEGALNYIVASSVSVGYNNIELNETIAFNPPRLNIEEWDYKHKEYYSSLEWIK